MASALGLPPMTKDLKPMEPFLKRAAELKNSDPIMAYWCAYYAAQLGISIKAKDLPSRNLLFDLLGSLEMTKKAIGPNEAIDIEAVSAAFVEDFALQIFDMADEEDRKGRSTNGTAKKFLAAANFLEVLKVFANSGGLSDDNQRKIRYAKWKAVDIAKAVKEGRRPTPGGPGDQDSSPLDAAFTLHPASDASADQITPSSSPPKPPQIKRTSPPPRLPASDIARANEPRTPPRALNPSLFHLDAPGLGNGESTPGSWSTAATPGTAYGTPGDRFPGKAAWDESPMPKSKLGLATQTDTNRKEWADGETTAGGYKDGESLFPRREGSVGTPDSGSPTTPPAHLLRAPSPATTAQTEDDDNEANISMPHQYPAPLSPEECVDLPPGFVPTHVHPTAPPLPPNFTPSPPQGYISPPPIQPPKVTYTSPPPPPPPQMYIPPVVASQPLPKAIPIPVPVPIELTPVLIAKTQKHCRYAISALDYEDAEGAKKELRAALALLGG